MGIRAELYKAYAEQEGKQKALPFLMKMFGLDAEFPEESTKGKAWWSDFTEDGGKGSGNWGHRGRPGKRGGSGKGGGKSLRTGNRESGYKSFAKTPEFTQLANIARLHQGGSEATKKNNRREFWNAVKSKPELDNALKEQHNAVSPDESYSDYVDRMYDMLSERIADEKTDPKVEEVMKSFNVGYRPIREMTNEQLTMSRICQRYGLSPSKIVNNRFSTKDKTDFLQMVGDRMNWGKRLIDRSFKHLSEQEKADMNALLDKYPWSDDPMHAGIPNEKDLYKTESEDVQDYYNALKAKAMGIGGVYVPDRPKELDELKQESEYTDAQMEAAKGAENYVDFWMNLPPEEQGKLKTKQEIMNLYEKMKQDVPEAFEKSEWKPTNGVVDDFSNEIGNIALPDDFPEIRICGRENSNDTRQAHAEVDGVIEVVPENWDDMSDEAISGIIAHEAGHQLSNHDPKLAGAIMMNYGDVFGRYNTERGFFDGIYGQSSPEEAFAQGCSEYVNRPEIMKQRYPEAYALFQKLEENNPGAIAYIRGTVYSAQEKLKSRQSMIERAKSQKERAFENSAEAKRPKCFDSDHVAMKDFKRIDGDHSWKDDLKSVNPGYNDDDMSDVTNVKPHNENCQRCITAYEARRRGFDVEADVVLNETQTNSALWWNSFGITGKDLHYLEERTDRNERKNNPLSPETLRKKADSVMLNMGNGARAVVNVLWKDDMQTQQGIVRGHVFIAENHNGVIRYIDPQSGSEDYSDCFENVNPEHVYLARIDDKPLQEQAARWCVKRDV